MAKKLDTESYKYGWVDAMLCKKLIREKLLNIEENKKYSEEFRIKHICLVEN